MRMMIATISIEKGREGDPQSGEIWKMQDSDSLRDISARFEKRCPNHAPFLRASEFNQRTRGNQRMPNEVGNFRGRGRGPISWGIHDSRHGLVDIAAPIIQPGPVPSAFFAGRGFPNVSNAQSSSWNAFGLVPGVPNCGFDSLHPLGLQGTIRPAISPSINIGIPRQRCRDFEERGFCLRGDMCPMEHGVNRIVIEDVQSLSQFNLPVSGPGSQLRGISSGQGALPVIRASDVYDPDQPLWTNDNANTAAPILSVNQSNADETETFSKMDLSDQRNIKLSEGFNAKGVNAPIPGPQGSTVRGRISSSKHSLGAKKKNNSARTSSSYLERAPNTVLPDVPNQTKGMNVDGQGPLPKESSLKTNNDSLGDIRKLHKALRTLFVNGIPLKDNNKEALLSHFQKFGEVIDIYIPMHSERAFVQFSKREEAEAALKAPDAVMGNRFIKLWWANRDNISDNGQTGSKNVPVTPHVMTLNPALSHPFVVDKAKENPHPAGIKDGKSRASVSQPPSYGHLKHMVANVPNAPLPQRKKLGNLEHLKEELRKKQEMLEQKRNEFRRQLDKLEKQAVGTRDVMVSDSTTTTPKGETPADHAKDVTSKSSTRDGRIMTRKATSAEPAAPSTSTSNQAGSVQETGKYSFCPLAPPGAPFVANRFKLDNRPTAFRIVPPLPAGLADVAALKEHFSSYGDLPSVELEEPKVHQTEDAPIPSDVSARVSFKIRRSAEKAFLHGKSWQGHELQFMWLTSVKEGGSLSASSDVLSNVDARPYVEDAASTHSPASRNAETDADSTSERDKKDSESISTALSIEKQLS